MTNYSQVEGSSVISLAMCANESFGMFACLAAWSVRNHIDDSCRVELYFVDNGLHAVTKRRMGRVFRRNKIDVIWLEVNKDRLSKIQFPPDSWLDDSSLLRLLLPDLLPAHVERIIYLDGDMLVRADLRPLQNLNLKGNPIAACRDTKYPTIGDSRSAQTIMSFGASSDFWYFNAGMYVADVAEWRRLDIASKTIKILEQKSPQLSHSDQDALNIVFANSWLTLEPKWNVVTSAYSNYAQDGQNAGVAIVHFTGPKPGQIGCQHPLEGLYLRELRRSGYFSRGRFWIQTLAWKFSQMIHEQRLSIGRMKRRILQ